MRPVTLPHHRTYGFPYTAVEPSSGHNTARPEGISKPSASRTLLSVERFANSSMVSPPSARHGCTVSAYWRFRVGNRSCCARNSSPHISPVSSSFSSSVPWFFGPSLHHHYSGFFTTTASDDFFRALTRKISPGKVQNLSSRAVRLYLMRLDDLWASLFVASLPPASGLTANFCSYGRKFANRLLQLLPHD